MLKEFRSLGHNGNGRLLVKIAGGASIMDPNGTFQIGKRNILAVKKNLWKYRLGALAEDIGQNYSRTVSVDAASFKVTISSPGKGEWDL